MGTPAASTASRVLFLVFGRVVVIISSSRAALRGESTSWCISLRRPVPSRPVHSFGFLSLRAAPTRASHHVIHHYARLPLLSHTQNSFRACDNDEMTHKEVVVFLSTFTSTTTTMTAH